MDSQRDIGSVDPLRDAHPVDGASYEYTTSREVTEYRTEVGHYRRPLLGVPWIAGLILVPALLAGLGLATRPATPAAPAPTAAATKTTASAATSSTTTATATAAPAPVAAFGLSSDGKTVTLTGSVPDAAAKTAAEAAAKAAFGSAVAVANNLSVVAGAPALGSGAISGLAAGLKGVTTPKVDLTGTTLKLSGVAATQAAKDAAIAAAKAAFPGTTVDASGITVSATTPVAPTCATASAYIKQVTDATKVHFASSGAELTTDSQAALKKIADAVKDCAAVKLLVAGNTDGQGDAAANVALSKARAEAVKAELVKLGVAAANITTVGNGETKPIGDNNTADGRNQNRRVDISVQ